MIRSSVMVIIEKGERPSTEEAPKGMQANKFWPFFSISNMTRTKLRVSTVNEFDWDLA